MDNKNTAVRMSVKVTDAFALLERLQDALVNVEASTVDLPIYPAVLTRYSSNSLLAVLGFG